jgi:ribonucleotide reductase beta subunit family protein with ferritin-like domain
MITTTDNPFNPFTQYDRWAAYDEKECGYYSASYLARIAATSPELSEAEMNRAIEDACDEICQMDLRYISPVTGQEVAYVKVTEQ